MSFFDEPEIKYQNDKMVISIKFNKSIGDFPIKKLFYFIAIPLSIFTTILTFVLDDFLNYMYKDSKEMEYKFSFTYYMQLLGNIFCYFCVFLDFLIVRQKRRMQKFSLIARITSIYYMILLWINLHTIKTLIFTEYTEYIDSKQNIEENVNHMLSFLPFLLYFFLIDNEIISNLIAQIIICFIRIFSISIDKFSIAHIFNNIISVVMFGVFIYLFNKATESSKLLDQKLLHEENLMKHNTERYEKLQEFIKDKELKRERKLSNSSQDDEKTET